jgi:hypothetical protein
VRGVAVRGKDLTDSVNSMASKPDVAGPQHRRRDNAVAKGDLSRRSRRREGRNLELKNTINTMVDQLSSFAAEVTRVAREVGTEGKLGGQATCAASPARGRTSPTT